MAKSLRRRMLQDTLTSRFAVKKILRIENADLWRRYSTLRAEMAENAAGSERKATEPRLMTRGVVMPGGLPLQFNEVSSSV